MIVTCPACDTRYVVDDSALGAGRRLRCASCGNIWRYSLEAAAIHEAIFEATAAAEAAAVATAAPVPTAVPSQVEQLRTESRDAQPHPAGPSTLQRPSVAVDLPAATRRRSARLRGIGLITLAIGIVFALYAARNPIVALWPAAAPVYTTLRLIEPPGAGLEVTVTPTRTSDSLVINGSVVNGAAVPRRIPQLRVTLRDGNNTNLDVKIIDPPVQTLAPGATARFNTSFDHPSITATGVAVTFVTQ